MNESENLVPKRRFKEFTNTGTWEQRKLGDLAEVRTGKAFSSADFNDDGEYLVVTNKNIQDDMNGIASVGDRIDISEETILNNYLLKGNNILVTMDGVNIGKTGKYSNEKSVLAQRVGRLNSEQLEFIYQVTNDNKFLTEMNKLSVGNAIKHISLKQISDYSFAAPINEEEQNKIGTFFEQLDTTIALHQRKLEKSKALKSAYLSEMFPAEGERKPKRRFAGFTDDWEQRKLGDVSPLRGGYAFQSEKFRSQGVPIIRISNILSDGNIGGNYAFYDEQETDDKYSLPDGAALLAMSGATTGKVAILSNPDNTKFYQNQRVGYFSDLKIVNYDFVSTIVRSNLFISQLSSVLVAGAQPNVSSKEIDSFGFYFPKTLKEQTKLGIFFKQLDETIALHQHKLEKLKNIKQAYLNELFV